MKIAIHQPNFMPWHPFFQKMQKVDKFIILGYCQFEKNGFQNRFKYEGHWKTLSVERGTDLIMSKSYRKARFDWDKIKMGFNRQTQNILDVFDSYFGPSLFDTNWKIIAEIKLMLGLETELARDYPTELTGTERLVDLCVKSKADVYLSGLSGKKYLDLSKFEEAGIKVEFQKEEDMDKRDIITVLNGLYDYVGI